MNVGNGLELISDTVYIGGTLSQDTTIKGNGKFFKVQNASDINLSANGVLDLGNSSGTGGVTINSGNQGLTLSSSADINISAASGDVTTTNLQGLVYTADYSATFVNNSLITKKYVDDAVAVLNGDLITGVTAGNGLSGGGTAGFITLDVNVANGLQIAGDNVEIAPSAAGNGLTFSAGVFAVNTANGLTINGDNVEIASSAAGDGLAYSAGVFSVNTANGLTVIGDNVQVAQTIAGQGLTFSSGVVDMVWGGTATGTTFSNDAVGVVVDGTTIQINTQGQLTVVAGASQPVYDRFGGSNTTADGQLATTSTLTSTPNDYSRVQVFVNGQQQRLGNGTKIGVDCYFSADGGTTARSLSALASGDSLYWNGSVAQFQIATSDVVEIVYEA